MIFNTVDSIVRRTLLENGYPVHYYAEYLYHCSAAVRELSFDTLQIVNTENLPVDSYGAANLPQDYVDEVAVSLNAGILLQPIPHKSNLNPLRLNDPTTGLFTAQNNPTINDDNNISFWSTAGFLWFWNISDWGEPTGRLFGANGGARIGYQIIKKRRQIQLFGNYKCGSIILQYISDGQRVDNGTQITPQAIACIQSYINWKRSPNAAIINSGEGMSYNKQKRLLRARLNDMTIADIKDALRSNYRATIKT